MTWNLKIKVFSIQFKKPAYFTLLSTTFFYPSNGEMCPTVIDKSQPIESIGSRLHDHTVFAHGATLVGDI